MTLRKLLLYLSSSAATVSVLYLQKLTYVFQRPRTLLDSESNPERTLLHLLIQNGIVCRLPRTLSLSSKDTSYKIRSVLIVAWGTNQLGLPSAPRGDAPATPEPVARFMTHLTTYRKAIH